MHKDNKFNVLLHSSVRFYASEREILWLALRFYCIKYVLPRKNAFERKKYLIFRKNKNIFVVIVMLFFM